MIRYLKVIFFLFLLNTFSYAQETFPINGVKESFKPVYAFINANIIISSEKEIDLYGLTFANSLAMKRSIFCLMQYFKSFTKGQLSQVYLYIDGKYKP